MAMLKMKFELAMCREKGKTGDGRQVSGVGGSVRLPWRRKSCMGERGISSPSATGRFLLGKLTKEMLKMKIEPTMCMKTKEGVTNCLAKMQRFAPNRHEFGD